MKTDSYRIQQILFFLLKSIAIIKAVFQMFMRPDLNPSLWDRNTLENKYFFNNLKAAKLMKPIH